MDKRKSSIITSALILIALFIFNPFSSARTASKMPIADAYELFQVDETVVILDVRNPHECKKST